MSTQPTASAGVTRRQFITRSFAVAATLSAGAPLLVAGEGLTNPVVVFSKVYQELKLNFEEAAKVTADAGLNGVDCPLRPKGEIEPERADEDLPRYAAALRNRGLKVGLLTTGILSPSTPFAERVLTAAKKEGVKYYRLGAITRDRNTSLSPADLKEVQKGLADLAAMNRQLGLTALLQNHSPSSRTIYLGGDLGELSRVIEPFKPDEIGAAYDIGHALIVHGEKWSEYFDTLQPRIKIAYVKDPSADGAFVEFGSGRVSQTDFFKRLKLMGYKAPVSLHVEFDWSRPGKTAAVLTNALRESTSTVRKWLSAA